MKIPDGLNDDLPFDDPEMVEMVGRALADVALNEAGVVVHERIDGSLSVGWPPTSLEMLGRNLLDALRQRGLDVRDTTP